MVGIIVTNQSLSITNIYQKVTKKSVDFLNSIKKSQNGFIPFRKIERNFLKHYQINMKVINEIIIIIVIVAFLHHVFSIVSLIKFFGNYFLLMLLLLFHQMYYYCEFNRGLVQ